MFITIGATGMRVFVGLLIAVPAAAVVGVLVRFALARYLDSDIYYGRSAELPWEEGAPHAVDHQNDAREIEAPKNN